MTARPAVRTVGCMAAPLTHITPFGLHPSLRSRAGHTGRPALGAAHRRALVTLLLSVALLIAMTPGLIGHGGAPAVGTPRPAVTAPQPPSSEQVLARQRLTEATVAPSTHP